MTRSITWVAATISSVCMLGACSRANIDAVNLSNEGDKARGVNVDDAISKYEQAKQLDPSNHRIQWKLATAYQKKEDWEKVNETLGPATKLAPDHANYFFLKGYALEQMAIKGPTNWAEAKDPLSEAAKLDPNFSDPHYELGNVDLHMDDEKGALEEWSKAVELKPDELSYYVPLANLYIRLQFLDQAEQVLKQASNFDKGGKEGYGIHTLYGLVHERKGDNAGAIAEYEAAKKACGLCNEKGEQIAFFNLGSAYARAKPPRRSEANSNLLAFQKTVCRGGAAARFADECAQAQEIIKDIGGAAGP